jgi:hypothetical protein
VGYRNDIPSLTRGAIEYTKVTVNNFRVVNGGAFMTNGDERVHRATMSEN